MRLFGFMLSMSLLCATPASADLYKWTDGSGTLHLTDDRANIPAKYRKKAQHLEGFEEKSPDDSAPLPRTGKDGAVPPGAAATAAVSSAGKLAEGTEKPERAGERGAPPEVKSLASTLAQTALNDRDKAYAAFSWIVTNIYYDNSTKWQRRFGQSGSDQSPAGVLASKRAVCEGMANLFAALVSEMGLRSAVVEGRASGWRQEPHAWNAVQIDGEWGLVDVTRKSFLTPPQEFLARHFPNDPQWQLIGKPLTYQEWLNR